MLEIFAGTRTDCAIDGFRVYFDSDDGVFFWIIAFLVISDDNHHVVVDVSVIALHVTETEARDVVFFGAESPSSLMKVVEAGMPSTTQFAM